jgi:hypothetical protein
MTISIAIKNTTLSSNDIQHHDTEYLVSFTLSVVILSVVRLSVVAPQKQLNWFRDLPVGSGFRLVFSAPVVTASLVLLHQDMVVLVSMS